MSMKLKWLRVLETANETEKHYVMDTKHFQIKAHPSGTKPNIRASA